MKMKKLTALALAGVLCLGMSTTAFAVDSPVGTDAANTKVTIKEKNKFGVEEEKPLDGQIVTNRLNEKDVADSFTLNHIEKWEKEEKVTVDGKEMTVFEKDMKDAVAAANAKGANIELDSKATYFYTGNAANYEFVTVDENGDEVVGLPEGAKATIRFNLDNVADIGEAYVQYGSRTIYLMHTVTNPETNETSFVMLKGEIVYKDGKYYTDVTFEDGLSPVAFVLEIPENGGNGDNGKPPVNVVIPDPDDNNTITPTPGTNGNGSVTVDDIANAVVKKLQSSNAKVIRTSTGVSPKTGE